MTDVTGNRSGHNSVTHDRKTIARPPSEQGPVYEYTNPGSPFGKAVCQCASALAYRLSNDYLLNHNSVPDGTLIARARVPAFSKKQVDGLVELFELKDVASSLGAIGAHLMGVEYASRTRGQTSGVARRSVMRSIRDEFASSPSAFLSSLVGVHLGYKFAIAPLARAVNDTMSAIGRVDKAMQRAAKPFAVHGTYRTEKFSNYSEDWSTEPATFGLYQTRFSYRKTTEVTFVQSALRRLDVSKVPSLDRMRLEAIRDSLGLRPSLGALWDMIPRSFVLDWFFPVRDFLEQAEGLNPTPEWFQTLGTYGSVKTVTTGSITEEFAPLESAYTKVRQTGGLNQLRGEYRNVTYTRTAVSSGSTWSPANIYVPEPRVPKWNQWFTLAEMLFQSSYQSFRVRGRSLGY